MRRGVVTQVTINYVKFNQIFDCLTYQIGVIFKGIKVFDAFTKKLVLWSFGKKISMNLESNIYLDFDESFTKCALKIECL